MQEGDSARGQLPGLVGTTRGENMREAGFEPTTSASGGQRSIQLSYSRRSLAEKRKAKTPRARSLSSLMIGM